MGCIYFETPCINDYKRFFLFWYLLRWFWLYVDVLYDYEIFSPLYSALLIEAKNRRIEQFKYVFYTIYCKPKNVLYFNPPSTLPWPQRLKNAITSWVKETASQN